MPASLNVLQRMLLFAVASFLAGCQPQAAPQTTKTSPCPASGARIVVKASGEVTLNGSPVAIESLGSLLIQSTPPFSVVCYYREDPSAAEPPPSAFEALDAVAAANLPITFYADPDFQNAILLE